ncbi:translation initiation factor IF-2 N-terminal domain-containing protein [Nocardia otitidiscaviarum]|uniref:translation initiation factor IF-2 N-terminal domain-containing protein n=1 Tax=Nocardia otitidiscaviarum TaxID=1823 RepID=UPI0009DFFDCF|nr:translation initiation factor IF-2 N-terminal domain-containing protein [Nocardia otitidiscaviarum]
MAEQEPQDASQVNGEGEAGRSGQGQSATAPAAEQLPERIRVHALAKLLGTTSKRILAHLTEMGAQARSPQSSLDRTVAETVRDAFGPRDVEVTAAPTSGTVAAEATAAETTAVAAAADQAAATVDEAIAAGDDRAADELAAEEVEQAEAAESTAAHQPTTLFASPFQSVAPAVEESVAFEPPAVVAAPLFLPPDATAAEELRRKRRVERKPKEEPVEETAPAAEEPAPAEDSTDEGDWDENRDKNDGASRRRRRGRRGRGRGRGEQQNEGEDNASESESDTDDEDETRTAADAEASAEGESGEDEAEESAVPEGASSRRRRRRRRRKGGEDGDNEPADDDPPNTVVHEREPRNKRRAEKNVDEVQGITGSTRLEAKRQRRRDGREAGRRRPPILTESEFLARRESVDRVMVVREKHFAEHPTSTTQVAVLEDNILVEHFVTSTGSASMVGNVYLGKVQNVLPSMEAAFVDIGRGRNGVLYAGEVNWEAAGLGGKERKIEQALRPGDTVLVQVSKDPVGHKGARLTTQISLAGRFLVYVPGGTSTGISRKLPDTERKRLKEILRDIVPQDAGVIIRTASEGVSESELARDVERLQKTWRTIEEQAKNGSGAPKTLYEEPDLLVKVVRDLFNEDFSKLVIEGDRAWTTVENYVRTVAPDMLNRVERHDGNGVDVFGAFRIDEQLAKALDRKVWLPSGGTLVIDRTEAMTVIDVNTGKFTGSGGSNLEETVTRNNLEAAEEIVRQMRLRDIGGMIVVDFIDMVLESNRDLVLRRLTEALGRDRTRHQVSEVTSLGLVQMTRKKLGTGLVEAFSTTCEHCHGRGILVHNYPVESAPAEEGGGRREGRRRRKDKGEKAAAAPEPAVVEEKAPPTEEKAAAKRAHPVALAMAAHQAEDSAHDAADAAAVAVEAVDLAVAQAETTGVDEAVADTAATPDVTVIEAADQAATAAAQAAAAAEEAAATAAELKAVEVQAAQVRSTEAKAADAGTARGRQSAEGARGAKARTNGTAAAAADAVVAPEADTAAGEADLLVTEAQAATGAQTAEAVGTGPKSGDAVAGRSTAAHPEPKMAVAEPEKVVPAPEKAAPAATTDETPAPAGRRRRRVARTAAAPAADSQGAVFVLSSTDQPKGAALSFEDMAPPPPPRARTRRRAAGRPAGAPEADG